MSSLESKIRKFLEELKRKGWKGTIMESRVYHLDRDRGSYSFEALLYKIDKGAIFIKIEAKKFDESYKLNIVFPREYESLIKKYFDGRVECYDDKCLLINNA